MAVGGLFKLAQRAFLSKPTPERQLLKITKRLPLRRVVELGVDSIETTARLLDEASRRAGDERVSYAALDAFDERPSDQARLPLIAAHRRLIETGSNVRLHPGGPAAALAGQANSMADTDLVLIGGQTTDADLAPAWFYLPRMCHPGTVVLRRTADDGAEDGPFWTELPLAELAERGSTGRLAHAA